MGKEDQIALRLQQGAAPRQLVAEGFSKSTVYKVAEMLRSQQVAQPSGALMVQLVTDRERYVPGGAVYASFTVTNQSAVDLYVFQAGVRPEWLPANDWLPAVVRRLLGAGESMIVRLGIPLPDDLPLGEKDVYFGIQGQWVGPQSASPTTELMWTSPLPLRVQRPRLGTRVFLAHSVTDVSLVRQLARTLEDNGIEAVFSDQTEEVGFATARTTDFLVALITDPHRLPMAAVEIGAAQKNAKDMLLLRDVSLASCMQTPLSELPWADLNFSLGAATVMAQVFAHVTQTITTRANVRKKERDDALGILLLGLGAVAAGVAIASGKGGG